MEAAVSRNDELRSKLTLLLGGTIAHATETVDVIVTPNEMNEQHGTGSLVRRLFWGARGIISIRARSDYDGDHDLGDEALLISHGDCSRSAAFDRLLRAMRGRRVRHVFCIPYVADDLISSIVLADAFQAPMCIWIMDDQNVVVNRIPDALMREALEKARLRLATHPEMRQAYERKFGLRFALLPAVVPGALVRHKPVKPASGGLAPRAALVGNVWSRGWLDRLCTTVSASQLQVDWYGNHQQTALKLTADDIGRLERSGIRAHGILPEPRLAEKLAEHACALVPTGMVVDDEGNEAAMARLSLPGRILFIAATSNTPVIVLGSEETSASRFVSRFGIGVTSPYEPEAFRRAVEQVMAPETQMEMRRRATRIAGVLSADGVRDWLYGSLERGEPEDDRFEELMPRDDSDLVAFIETAPPADVYREYIAEYHALCHLKSRGFQPEFVIDVGASVGIWSWVANKVFPDARFILIDPLATKYDARGRQYYVNPLRRAESIDAAVSNAPGTATLHVPVGDLYGASLLPSADSRKCVPIEVPVHTLDELAVQHRFEGRGLLKADVQFAEHLVLEGARQLLPKIDAIVLELSLLRNHPQGRTLLEMMNVLDRHGFRYFDDAGCWRSPTDGMLIQKDVLFVRRGICESGARI